MFTKSNAKRSFNRVDPDKRKQIADYIVDYVRRNPGKQIPSTDIGLRFETPAHNLSTIIAQLLKAGAIRHRTPRTYELNVAPNPFVPAPTPQTSMAVEIERLAKDYVWQVESPTLKGFVDWVKTEAK